MPYRPPAPPEGTGPHRYIWLLYQQPRVFQIKDVPVKPTGFNVTTWATANGLEPAVAGTYFEAEFADGRASNASSSSAVSSKHSSTPTSSAAGKTSVSATTSATESGSSLPRASTSASRTNAVVGRNEDKVWWILLAVVGAHLGVGVVL
ncbi:hypothetical protein K440DRAFT_620460 [Wilcoxina mikolae CBS 423.85]|nr:hypothetical protein K440DRAFT_620460 [Wilcoxina mikolae CBS 423.85]